MLRMIAALLLSPLATMAHSQTSQKQASDDIYWHRHNTELRGLVRHSRYAEQFPDPFLELDQTDVLRSSGMHVAVVDLGGYGASTDGVVLVESRDGRVANARLLATNGKQIEEVLTRGASNGHNDQVEIFQIWMQSPFHRGL